MLLSSTILKFFYFLKTGINIAFPRHTTLTLWERRNHSMNNNKNQNNNQNNQNNKNQNNSNNQNKR